MFIIQYYPKCRLWPQIQPLSPYLEWHWLYIVLSHISSHADTSRGTLLMVKLDMFSYILYVAVIPRNICWQYDAIQQRRQDLTQFLHFESDGRWLFSYLSTVHIFCSVVCVLQLRTLRTFLGGIFQDGVDCFNKVRPRQNSHHVADNFLKFNLYMQIIVNLNIIDICLPLLS